MKSSNVSHHAAMNSNDMELTVTAEVGDCAKDSDDEGEVFKRSMLSLTC